MQEQPNYFSIIPANVRYDKELSPSEKLLYGEISALSNKEGFCWATNNYFAELYEVTPITVSRWVNALKKKGYIKIEMIHGEKGEIAQRKIYISTVVGGINKNVNRGINKNVNRGINKNVKDNNTSINNTSINNKNHKSVFEKTDPTPYKKIIDYLNEKTGKRFKVTLKHKDSIKARWNEGQRLEDFKAVIDLKTKQWKGDPKMDKYLRPETLFSGKFDSYLNETLRKSSGSYAGIEFGTEEKSDNNHGWPEF